MEHAGNSYWPVLVGTLVQMASADANPVQFGCGKVAKQHVLQHVYSMIGLLRQPFIWISGQSRGAHDDLQRC